MYFGQLNYTFPRNPPYLLKTKNLPPYWAITVFGPIKVKKLLWFSRAIGRHSTKLKSALGCRTMQNSP